MKTKIALGLAGLIASSSMNGCMYLRGNRITKIENKSYYQKILKTYFTDEAYNQLKDTPLFEYDAELFPKAVAMTNMSVENKIDNCIRPFYFGFSDKILFSKINIHPEIKNEIIIHEFIHESVNKNLINKYLVIDSYFRFKDNYELYNHSGNFLNYFEEDLKKYSKEGIISSKDHERIAYLGVGLITQRFKAPSYIHNEFKNILKVSQDYFKKDKKKKHK